MAEIATAFFVASPRSGDVEQLRALLATDVTAYADGSGKKTASLQPIVGIGSNHRPACLIGRQFADGMSQLLHTGFINGLPGFVTLEKDDTLQTTAFEIEDRKIVAIYITRNPDKLRHTRS